MRHLILTRVYETGSEPPPRGTLKGTVTGTLKGTLTGTLQATLGGT